MSEQKPDTPDSATRRSVLKMGVGISISPVIGAAWPDNSNAATADNGKTASDNPKTARQGQWTPSQTEGPFYPDQEQQDKDVDLTLIEGRTDRASGEVIFVRGRVLDTNGSVISNAFVEIWQANTFGRYRNKKDPNNAPLDPNFQGWGQTYTDANGYYGFKTILPGAYPAGPGWTRPPHIHFKAAKENYYPLTTQMYFPGQQLNREDLILQHLSSAQQDMVIARRQDNNGKEPVFVFDIILRRAS